MWTLKASALIACAVFAAPLGLAHAAPNGNETVFNRLCADQRMSHAGEFADGLGERLHLSDTQKAAFQDFQATRAKALADSKTKLCNSKPDLTTFEGRLVFDQSFHEAQLEAVKQENPKLIAFYKSLDPEQQKMFDEIRERGDRR